MDYSPRRESASLRHLCYLTLPDDPHGDKRGRSGPNLHHIESFMNEPPSRVTTCSWKAIGPVVALLVIFAALCMGSGWNTSPTFDETFFIGAGYSFLKGDEHSQPTANLVLAEKWV